MKVCFKIAGGTVSTATLDKGTPEVCQNGVVAGQNVMIGIKDGTMLNVPFGKDSINNNFLVSNYFSNVYSRLTLIEVFVSFCNIIVLKIHSTFETLHVMWKFVIF